MGRPRYGYGYGYARSGDAPINPSTILGTSLSAWFDPSDLGTMWQDTAATTPAVVGQPVALQLDKRPGVGALGAELKGASVVGLLGSATAATYNTSTGAGTVTRVDAANQSYVTIPITSGRPYKVTITNTGAVSLLLRDGAGGAALVTLAAGATYNGYIMSVSTNIAVTVPSAATGSFTLTSAKEVLGAPRYQSTLAQRPILGRMPKSGRRNIIDGSATMATQTQAVTAAAHTLSFTGTGTVTLSGASTAGPLVGTGASNRVSLTFTPTAGNLTMTVTGSVTNAQLELGSTVTNYQTTASAYDCTEVPYAHCYYLQADGNDDFYTTPDLDLSTITSDGQARRNLLLYPEDFSASVWEKLVGGTGITPTVTPNNAIAPDGTVTAYTIVLNTGVGVTSSDVSYVNQFTTTFVGSAVASVWLKTTDGTTKTLGLRCGAPGESTITVTGEWQRFQVVSVAATIDRIQILNYGNYSNASVSVDLWHPQLETGSTATDYQKIGTDKVAVFAGIRKLSDAARGMFVELGTLSTQKFAIEAPSAAADPANIMLASNGSGTVAVAFTTGRAAPYTAVVGGICAISTDTDILRINGAQAVTSSTDQGTGNYGNYPLYFYRRGGTSLPFKGMDFGCVLATGTLTDAQITAMERYIARNTPEVNL